MKTGIVGGKPWAKLFHQPVTVRPTLTFELPVGHFVDEQLKLIITQMRARAFYPACDVAADSVPSDLFLAGAGEVAAKVPLSVQKSAQEQVKVRDRTFEATRALEPRTFGTRLPYTLPDISVPSTIQQ